MIKHTHRAVLTLDHEADGRHVQEPSLTAEKKGRSMKSKLTTALRTGPALLLLLGVATMAPGADATGTKCYSPKVLVDGGNVTTTTDLDFNANGGTATGGQANGGNDNTATGGAGGAGGQNGAGGDGGAAAAGNGGDASAEANGGTITVGSIDTGNNTGNDIDVE